MIDILTLNHAGQLKRFDSADRLTCINPPVYIFCKAYPALYSFFIPIGVYFLCALYAYLESEENQYQENSTTKLSEQKSGEKYGKVH